MRTDIQPIASLGTKRAMVIDLDTGTVLGTNLVLAYVSEAVEEEILDSDSEAREYGRMFGQPLLVDLADM
jgi:hypothetical protein